MFRAGDAIRHKPSGEKWSVAYCEDGRVCARGWPLSWADEADCELVTAVSDENHKLVLLDMATMSDKSDPRCRRARLALNRPVE